MTHPRHGIGANQPPPPLAPADILAELTVRHAALLARRDELLGGVAHFREAHPTIDSDQVQGDAADFTKQIAACVKSARELHAPAKRPFLDAGRAVDAFFKAVAEPLEAGAELVRERMTAFALEIEARNRAVREHDAQRARDAARRALAEAGPQGLAAVDGALAAAERLAQAERAAQAPAAALSRSRGAYGSVASLREDWEIEVVDVAQVPARYLSVDLALVRRDVLAGGPRDVPGLSITARKRIGIR